MERRWAERTCGHAWRRANLERPRRRRVNHLTGADTHTLMCSLEKGEEEEWESERAGWKWEHWGSLVKERKHSNSFTFMHTLKYTLVHIRLQMVEVIAVGRPCDKYSLRFQHHLFKQQCIRLSKGLEVMEKWSEQHWLQVNYRTLSLGWVGWEEAPQVHHTMIQTNNSPKSFTMSFVLLFTYKLCSGFHCTLKKTRFGVDGIELAAVVMETVIRPSSA